MTIQGARDELINMMECKDIPLYFVPILQKVVETIEMEFATVCDIEQLKTKIIGMSCRYSIARERGCGGQVEWSDRLIKQEDVLKAFEEYQKGGKE